MSAPGPISPKSQPSIPPKSQPNHLSVEITEVSDMLKNTNFGSKPLDKAALQATAAKVKTAADHIGGASIPATLNAGLIALERANSLQDRISTFKNKQSFYKKTDESVTNLSKATDEFKSAVMKNLKSPKEVEIANTIHEFIPVRCSDEQRLVISDLVCEIIKKTPADLIDVLYTLKSKILKNVEDIDSRIEILKSASEIIQMPNSKNIIVDFGFNFTTNEDRTADINKVVKALLSIINGEGGSEVFGKLVEISKNLSQHEKVEALVTLSKLNTINRILFFSLPADQQLNFLRLDSNTQTEVLNLVNNSGIEGFSSDGKREYFESLCELFIKTPFPADKRYIITFLNTIFLNKADSLKNRKEIIKVLSIMIKDGNKVKLLIPIADTIKDMLPDGKLNEIKQINSFLDPEIVGPFCVKMVTGDQLKALSLIPEVRNKFKSFTPNLKSQAIYLNPDEQQSLSRLSPRAIENLGNFDLPTLKSFLFRNP